MEEELFKLCKGKEEDEKVSVGVLLHELKNMGIRRDDPRLESILHKLKLIRRNSASTGTGDGMAIAIENIQLNLEQFKRVIGSSMMLISKTFRGHLIIPEFEEFCNDISSIFMRCNEHSSGSPAKHIPQLARSDPSKWAVSLCTVDGQRFSLGDFSEKFTLQSTSKPFTYALSLDDLGAEAVSEYMGEEPSGRVYNEIALDYNGQPHNPMINSGAIMSAALLLYMVKPELSISEKFEFVLSFFQRMAGGLSVGFNNSVFLSERESADRNHALAYFMREQGCFPKGPNNQGGTIDIKNILDFYFQLCSLEATTESMSIMAGTLANGGICPLTGERVLDGDAVKNVLSLMYSCGMYNYSGQFAFKVGLPAKSGVSGIIIVIVPNVVGFATYSPPLDTVGNSARGVMFFEELVKIYKFHLFDSVGIHATDKKCPILKHYESKSQILVQVLFAASNGDRLALERAYLSGANMDDADYDGRTALHLAASDGHLDCVRFLLEICKVNPHGKDRWGNSPLCDAKLFSRPQVATLLQKFLSNEKSTTDDEIAETTSRMRQL